MNPLTLQTPTSQEPFRVGRFEAMGSPCELLISSTEKSIAETYTRLAAQEAHRIEQKFSRYVSGNSIDQINRSQGRAVQVDAETSALLDFAARCYELSNGLFDVTSGVLRALWTFDGSESNPSAEAIAAVRSHVGWDQVQWESPTITLPHGFEIDFGGICKEYAADRILARLLELGAVDVLVNLGGDIAAAGTRPWTVGIEDPSRKGQIRRTIELAHGGIATSGVTKRYTTIEGKRMGHLLNPLTGMPVDDMPLSVTVQAATCTEAGFWSTLAMLHGPDAETFLSEQSLPFWCYR